jgi:glycosyltransferase involved in cell wall biosynthesis
MDNLAPGGAQHILLALTQADPAARVCVLHAKGGAGEMTDRFPGADILARSKRAIPAIVFGLVRVVLRHRSRAFFNAHLEASTLFMCLLRRLIDFRLVVTVHATQRQWPPWFRAVFRRVIFYADHVIAESQRAYDEIRALGVTEERLALIPIGTLGSAAARGGAARDIRKELDIAPDVPIFLNIARMVPGKGQIDLVRAMADVADAVAVIVGYGPEEDRLRSEVARLGLQERVRFAGLRTDLENFYCTARAFVMPCLDESMGIVIYDALTWRLPVVAYASGSIGEIVSDGENGYLLPPDPGALAAALRRVLQNETAFRFLQAASYSAATMVEGHQALYLELGRKWSQPGGSDA